MQIFVPSGSSPFWEASRFNQRACSGRAAGGRLCRKLSAGKEGRDTSINYNNYDNREGRPPAAATPAEVFSRPIFSLSRLAPQAAASSRTFRFVIFFFFPSRAFLFFFFLSSLPCVTCARTRCGFPRSRRLAVASFWRDGKRRRCVLLGFSRCTIGTCRLAVQGIGRF